MTIDEEVEAISTRKRGGLTFVADKSPTKTAVQLTPVGTERKPRIPDMPTIYMPQEAIEGVVRNIRAASQALLLIADAIDFSLGNEPPPDPGIADVARATAEREADEKHAAAATELFAASFAAKQRAAEAATYTARDVPPTAKSVSDWLCPAHGDAALVVLTAKRSRRTYLACTDCDQFEKGN